MLSAHFFNNQGEKTIRKIGRTRIIIKQTINYIENVYRDIDGFKKNHY